MLFLQICPSTGRPCDCGAAPESNGLPASLAASSSGSTDEADTVEANGHANGHSHGAPNKTANGSANGHATAENGSCKDHSCGQMSHTHGSVNGGKFASGGIPDGPKVDVLSDSNAKKADSKATVQKTQVREQQWTSAVEPIFPTELRKRSPPELHLPGPYATWRR